MNEELKDMDVHFLQLVLSMQAGAVQQMGKIVSPVTGKVERNLEAAKFSIDMLSMLETKTKENLTEDESKLLGHVLYELRMNYVDEAKKGDSLEAVGNSGVEGTNGTNGTNGTDGAEPQESSVVEEKETTEDGNGSESKEDAGNSSETTDS